MNLVHFRDGVVIKLHKDCSFDVMKISRSDVEFNRAFENNDKAKVFNIINNRLGGALTA